jgi:uncharacterized protein (DUF427 family)
MDERTTSRGPAPGFIESPGHRVDVERFPKRVRVMLGGETVADSTGALLMLETNHKPVFYFPRADVRMSALAPSDHTTY